MTGKEKCSLLREIRREIAETNGIDYPASECTVEGECTGTCPKCDAEIRYLDREINRLIASGKQVTLAGLSLRTFDTAVENSAPAEPAPMDRPGEPDPLAPPPIMGLMAGPEHFADPFMPIAKLHLSVRAYTKLRRHGILTVRDLTKKTERQLLEIRGLRQKELEEIRDALSALGMYLAEE